MTLYGGCSGTSKGGWGASLPISESVQIKFRLAFSNRIVKLLLKVFAHTVEWKWKKLQPLIIYVPSLKAKINVFWYFFSKWSDPRRSLRSEANSAASQKCIFFRSLSRNHLRWTRPAVQICNFSFLWPDFTTVYGYDPVPIPTSIYDLFLYTSHSEILIERWLSIAGVP